MYSVPQTHFLVYKITNTINGRIYIGCHKTKNPNDGYMGSGKIIKRAIAKNGVEHFNKEILFDFNNSKDMFAKEKELIARFRPDYNLHEGGSGGFDYINANCKPRRGFSDLDRKKAQIRLQELQKNNEWTSKKISRLKLTMSTRDIKPTYGFKGKHHTPETKAIISAKNSLTFKGKNNPNYGKKWVSKNGISKMVLKEEVHSYQAVGWLLGIKKN